MPKKVNKKSPTRSGQGVHTIKGKVWRFGDDISTDDIISGIYLSRPTIDEMAPHTFSVLRPEFGQEVQPNDIVVGGVNFGIGSSREEAPAVFLNLRIGAVVAASFARIFFRNAFNLGLAAVELPALITNPDLIREDDQLTLHLDKGSLLNHRTGATIKITKIPSFLLEYLKEGGALPVLQKRLARSRR